MKDVRVERLDHLDIVAGICREIGLAKYLDNLARPSQQQVSVDTGQILTACGGSMARKEAERHTRYG